MKSNIITFRILRSVALGSVLALTRLPLDANTLVTLPSPAIASFQAGTLHVDKYGSGKKNLILVPGLASGPWVWTATIAKFSPDYTIYALTLPGFDVQAFTKEAPLFAAFARDFWTLLAGQKIEKPVIIGHSLGGTLAIALAEQHPERISAIIAVDGLPVFPTLAFATAEQRTAAAAQMAAAYSSLDTEKALATERDYMANIGTIRSNLVDSLAKLAAHSDPHAVGAWVAEDLTNDLRPNLSKIVVPLLEIMPYNADDAKVPNNFSQDQVLGFYRALLNGAPKASVVPISPARHFVMLDQPEIFQKEIIKFLSTLDPH